MSQDESANQRQSDKQKREEESTGQRGRQGAKAAGLRTWAELEEGPDKGSRSGLGEEMTESGCAPREYRGDERPVRACARVRPMSWRGVRALEKTKARHERVVRPPTCGGCARFERHLGASDAGSSQQALGASGVRRSPGWEVKAASIRTWGERRSAGSARLRRGNRQLQASTDTATVSQGRRAVERGAVAVAMGGVRRRASPLPPAPLCSPVVATRTSQRPLSSHLSLTVGPSTLLLPPPEVWRARKHAPAPSTCVPR